MKGKVLVFIISIFLLNNGVAAKKERNINLNCKIIFERLKIKSPRTNLINFRENVLQLFSQHLNNLLDSVPPYKLNHHIQELESFRLDELEKWRGYTSIFDPIVLDKKSVIGRTIGLCIFLHESVHKTEQANFLILNIIKKIIDALKPSITTITSEIRAFNRQYQFLQEVIDMEEHPGDLIWLLADEVNVPSRLKEFVVKATLLAELENNKLKIPEEEIEKILSQVDVKERVRLLKEIKKFLALNKASITAYNYCKKHGRVKTVLRNIATQTYIEKGIYELILKILIYGGGLGYYDIYSDYKEVKDREAIRLKIND